MISTWALLLGSRKFWVGTLTVASVFVATYLRAKGLIPADALLPTILGVATAGISVITANGLEDAAKHLAGAPPGPAAGDEKEPAKGGEG
jgi:hypothetical protein